MTLDLESALAAYRKSDFAAAEALLQGIASQAKAPPDTWIWLARSRLRRGDGNGAENALRQAMNQTETAALASDLLREWLIGEGRRDEALALASQKPQTPRLDASATVDLGLAQQGIGNTQAAVDYYRRAIKLDSGYAPAYNHLGRALNNLRQHDQAEGAFARAVAFDGDYLQAWHNLGHVWRAQGRLDKARHAFERALALYPRYYNARMNLGTVLLASEDPHAALDCFQSLLEQNPADIDAVVYQGASLHALGRFERARAAFERAIAVAPEHVAAHVHLASVLNEMHDSENAERHLKRALEIAPNDVTALTQLAALYELDNRLEDARRTVASALKVSPQDGALNVEAARLERRAGRYAQAVSRLRALSERQLRPRELQQREFELGLSLDAEGDSAAAFVAFASAKRMAIASMNQRQADPARFHALIAKLRRWIDRADPTLWNQPEPGPSPVFMVGFPRSGVTLTEMMLGNHPNILSLQELATVEHVAAAVDRIGGYPEHLDTLDAGGLARMIELYHSQVRQLAGDPGDRVVLDSMPIRTMHAGLIHRLFPQARFVFVQRHPLDVVLSCFTNQFAQNDASACFGSLEESARTYVEVMELWQACFEKLPLRVHTVRYETLVIDPDATMRETLEFLDLPWSAAVLGMRVKPGQRVRTRSYQQVGRSLYGSARMRWKRYTEQLEPVVPLLEPWIRDLGYEMP